jgi:hypothetical protein
MDSVTLSIITSDKALYLRLTKTVVILLEVKFFQEKTGFCKLCISKVKAQVLLKYQNISTPGSTKESKDC